MKCKIHILPPGGWTHRWPTQRRHLGVQKVVAMVLSGNRVAVMVWCGWLRPCSRVCGVILANDPESTSISLLSTEHYPKAIKQDYWSSLSLSFPPPHLSVHLLLLIPVPSLSAITILWLFHHSFLICLSILVPHLVLEVQSFTHFFRH